MTSNELAVTDIQFAVNYTPSKITIENEDQLEALINQVTEHYGVQVFSDSNIPEAKEARAQLNKYVKAMEDRRKEIKREFTQPLTQFESVMKGYVEKITTISDDIGEGIKKYEEEQRAIRLEKIQAEMLKLSELFNVEPDVIEVHSNWLAKSAFTTKDEVRPKIIDEIKDKMKIVAMERDRVAADKATITDYAEIAGLDPYAWANMIDQGWNVADVREKIKQAVENKRLREEQAEQRRIAQEEHDAALAKLAEEQALQQAQQSDSGNMYDRETGELIQSQEQVVSLKQMTVTLKLSGSLEQMNALNQYLVDNGIEVVPVK
ncbi:hypothetical protein IGI66_001768 [Enterococcus sp. AZ048]|uniref:DUF1351 domain-containing protein n=1 Tax=Enterococcus sp. AZ048 TaxID=2774658 RepID=UPI003F20BE91